MTIRAVSSRSTAARQRGQRTARRHQQLAAALVAVASVAVIGCSRGGGTTKATTTTAEVTTTTFALPAGATATGLRSIESGQCFELPKDDPAAQDRAVWVLPCTDPHTHEAYAVLTYDGTAVKGGGYPGTNVVQDWAEQSCYAAFEEFVGVEWTASSFDIETWWPSAESWGQKDRKVICSVYKSSGGRSTGTARGTAQ